MTPETTAVRLVLVGELDGTTVEDLHRAVEAVLGDPAPVQLTIEARELSFLDSSGLRCLVIWRDRAEAAGCGLLVAEPSPSGYVGKLERRLLPTFSATRFGPRFVSVSFSATRRRLPVAYS